MLRIKCALLCLAIAGFVFSFTGCSSSAPPISVAVTASATTVDGSDTVSLTAAVANDQNSGGVKWSLSGPGALSGTTTTSATYTAPAATSSSQTATVTATSVADSSKTGTATITIPAAPSITSTSVSLTGAVGTAYSVTLQASGGIAPYTWAITTGTLPTCLTLNASSGVISGTPVAACAGTDDPTFTVTDSGSPNKLTGTASLTLTITAPTITFSPTLPAGAVGTAYTGSVAATGALGTTTYSIASGALPPDLSLNTSTGAITGTPKTADVGTATFAIKVVDAYGDTATSGSLSITIAAAPAITFGAAPTATATFGVAYTSSVTASGGAGSLTYGLASGSLPPDLTLASSGAITGTPKAADIGTFTFAVKAADAYGDSATSGNFTLVVSYPAVMITPGAGSLPLAVTGQAYSQTLTASGGSGAGFTWTVSGLPANGLSYAANGATLTISGQAASTGTVSFTASVTDGAGNSAGPLSYSIQVYSPVTLPSANPTSLPSTATVNLAYTGTITASGGSGNYSWTVSGLSDGLSSTSNGGTLTVTGTPTSAAAVTFTASVKDTTTGVTAGPVTYTITVYATVTLPATNPSTLGPAIVSTPYTGTIVAAGGSGNYSWTVTGFPQDGLNYSTSGATLTVSGTAGSTPTTVSFTAKVTDTTTSQSSGPYTYTIGVYNALTLSASGLPLIATVNTAYSGTITASGGSGTGYVWTVTGLSDGLNSSSSGGTLTISGTPTSAAAIQFTVSVKDSVGNSAGPASYTINAYNPLSLPATNPATLGPATINLSYTGTVVASGGSGNYSWTVTGLPSDSLNYSPSGATLTISGTPTSATTVNFTAKVTDTTTGNTAGPYNYSVTVYASVTLPAANPPSLGSANVGTSYSGSITAAGGSGNYSWTVTGLPSDGLNYSTSGSTVTITGTPATATTVQFNVSVKDTATGNTAGPVTYSTTVYGALSLPTPNPSSLPSGYTGVAYTGSVSGSGGSGNLSLSITSALSPSDGTLTASVSGTTVNVTGTPATATTESFTVQLTDSSTSNNISQTYTISITTPIAVSLPAPSSTVPGPATVGQSYTGSITASNGVPPYTWSINGTTVTSGGISIGDSLTASSTAGSTLSFSGTPASAQTITLTNVKVVDSENPSTNASNTYSIQVNNSGGQISGQINLMNVCNVSTLPTFTVTLNTTPATQVQTNSTGQFTFNNVAAGTYTITPSIPGATSSLFYPASYTGLVISNGSNLTSENFNANVGYTVSGAVTYGGSQTGQTYLYVQNNNCGGSDGNPGTSITEATLTSGGSYSIRGVPSGSYTLYAWMDSTGITSGTDYPGPQGAPNTNDPTGSNSSVSVTNANVTTANVTLQSPAYATPPSNPSFQVIPANGGWLLFYSPPTVSTSSGNKEEAANEYTVEWAVPTGTDSAGNQTCALGGGTGGAQFGTVAGSHTFYAISANGATVWFLNNTSMGAGTFNGGAYCFQARAFNTLAATTHPSGWYDYTDSSGSPEAVAPATSTTFCTSNCTTVSGAVTIPSGVTIAAGAPLYIGYYQQSSSGKGPSAIYGTEVASPVSGGSGNSYQMTIPNGSGYILFGILDQNNDGAIDAGDVTNTRNNNSNGVTFSGGSVTGQNVTLPSANSTVTVQTQYFTSNCTGCTSYSVDLQINEANKLPVAVTLSNTLVATPYLMMPVDIMLCANCGNVDFDYSANLPGGTPSVGDSFDFTVTYSDGTQDTGTTVNGAVTAFGSTGTVVGASDVATNLQTAGSNPLEPNFTWTFPANPSDYVYEFYLSQNSNCSGNCTIWQIPGQNSSSNGFTYAETETGTTTGEITWGVDPTGGGSTPSGSLNSSDDYSWSISVQDSNGNQAQSSASDNNP